MTIQFETANGMIDTTAIPAHNVNALVMQALGHKYGNEVASKISTTIGKKVDPDESLSTDARKAAIKVWRESNADAVAEMVRKAHEDLTKVILEGTIGVRAGGGSRVDPLTRELRSRAAAEVVAILKNVGAIGKGEKKYPAADEEFTIAGQAVTFGALVDRRLANPKEGPRLRKEVEAHLAALARQKARVEAQAEEIGKSGASSLEDMGL